MGHLAIQFQIAGEVDLAHATRAELLQDPVMAERRADGGSRH
jgi:hypothetical protein